MLQLVVSRLQQFLNKLASYVLVLADIVLLAGLYLARVLGSA
jgi:hypothetical protein